MNLDPSSSKALVPRVNKANNLLELILSKPFVKVIIRVDTSRHRVIIINISVLIAKINVLIANNTHCGN